MLPTIVWQVAGLGIFDALVCVFNELTRIQLSISSILITTLGFIVGLTLSFRTNTAYQRWWEARQCWDRLTATSRSLARFIWVSVPEKDGSSRDVLLKKSAINLIGIFAVSLKNHLRDQRGHVPPDIASMIPHLDTYSRTQFDARPHPLLHADTALDREEAEVRSTWFLHRSKQQRAAQATTFGNFSLLDDWCEATQQAGVMPTEITFHLASYMEYIRSENPGLSNYLPQNFNLALNTMNEIVSSCERIRRTPIPIAYNIVISQILWIFCLSLPFQLVGQLSWASVPLCMVASAFLFSLHAIGSEIEDPFGKDANDLDLERYCRAIRTELDVLTSIPPPTVEAWALENPANIPLNGVSNRSLLELEKLPVHEIRKLLADMARGGYGSGHRTTPAAALVGIADIDTSNVAQGDSIHVSERDYMDSY